MAAYTSTQSGNWNSTATWGGSGYPVDGDTWTISAGHTITYNITTYQATGVGNGIVNNTGRLTFATNGKMKLNGLLDIYGDLIMIPNTEISIRGGNTEGHGIYVRHPTTTSTFHRIEMQGSAGTTETTISSAITSKQGYLPVASSAGFAVGDWVSAFKRGLTSVTERTDEGFLVHDISGNNIYVREFVGPSSIIQSFSGSTITVQDASIFREWQTVIFGTGANLNVRNVSSINYTTNVITLSSAVTGSVNGQTVYTTGPIRQKNSGDIVRKVATSVTAEASSSATSIVVGSTSGFSVGDQIIIDSRSDGSYTDERPERKTITGISGNTIIVDSSFGYTLYAGSFVVRLTRNCKIQTDQSGTHYGFFRIIENNTVNSNNRLIMKDVEFRDMGTSVDDFRSRSGPTLSGRYYNDLGADGVEIEAITSHRDAARNLTSAGFYFYRFGYNWTVRNCVSFESVQGIWVERGYEFNDMAWFNNYSARAESYGFRWQNMRYEWNEFAYNYTNRTDDGALLVNASRATGIGLHHNWFNVGQGNGINSDVQYGSFCLYQNRIESVFGSAIYGFNNGMGNFIYNEIIQGATQDFGSDLSIQSTIRGLDPNQSAIMLEHNYKLESVCEFFPAGKREWNKEENAWLVTHDNDAFSSTIGSGHIEIIYIPPKVSFDVYVDIKLVAGFSGTPPVFEVREITNRGTTSTNFIAGHAGNPLISYVKQQSSVDSDGWQTMHINVPATKYGTRYSIGVITYSNTSSEGWYEKPIKYILSEPLPTQEYAGINKYSGSSIKADIGNGKLRLGGRIS
jgi:hypothetical protein